VSEGTWKDTSSFSQDDKVRAPHEWTADLGDTRVIVHGRIDDPGAWYVSVHGGVSIGARRLVAETPADAKLEALSKTCARLDMTLDAARAALDSSRDERAHATNGKDGGK
jgi:hypothetical protein